MTSQNNSEANICTMCGSVLNEWDMQENFSVSRHIGYGSRYDMHILKFKLLCDCFDKMLDIVLPMFQNNPLKEYE